MKYLTEKYGKPETFLPSEYDAALSGRKGIIIFEVHGWSDATGHADLWNGKECVYQGYGDASHKISFWEAS
ncbi:T6SS effector amidase Tae4 family protein [Agarivorans sp. Alg241-V36]|uniref:T6SS effector amidase Tae4 family protein n=1 Tax=Agarivorans sp. Alg241-V36 TaxID=2305992 RepID=UPI00351BAFB9